MQHIEEDWERLPYLTQCYLQEKQIEEEEEWQHWLEDQQRKPAKVKIIHKKKHEIKCHTPSFSRDNIQGI